MATETPKVARARLYAGIGAALGILATVGAELAKQNGKLEGLSGRYLAATLVPVLLALAGLSLYERRPRPGGTLVVIGAGLLLGIAAVGSADWGLLWLPAAILLTIGAYGLVSAWPRPPSPPSR